MDQTSLNSLLMSINRQRDWIRTTLRDLVLIESPSENKVAVDSAVAYVESLAAGMGARIKRHPQTDYGDVLELRFGPLRPRRKPVLLLGHLDTVWPMGTLATMPWREEGGRFYGPGAFDMKGGVVMALAAIRALQETKLTRSTILLLNSDEEIGSPISRPISEKLALLCSAVFVLEPAQGLAYKTARKGVGQYNLKVTGIGAHSGVDFERGHSAVLEMAKLVQTASNFTDPGRKLTVNCGVFTGGTRSNVVPAEARAEIDVRISRAADARYVEKLFRSLKVSDPHCKLEITGGMNRPPMERKGGTIALYRRAKWLAAELGFLLDEAATGGGSDGNFTAALNIPTLDGMGAVGSGAHAAHEHVSVEHMAPRATLLAAMIASVS